MKNFDEFRDIVQSHSEEIHQKATDRVNASLSEIDLGGGIGEQSIRQKAYGKYQTLELLELYHKWANGDFSD